MGDPRVDPFVFVAATRYAILRTLTSASETVASQIAAHAGLIREDAGVRAAIVKEIEDAMPRLLEPEGFGQTAEECARIARAWRQAAEALGR